MKPTDGDQSIFKSLKLAGVATKEPAVNVDWASLYPSARKFATKSGLCVVITNEEKTNGYSMVVWHHTRWPSMIEVGLLKQALIPDSVAMGIPFGTKQEIDAQPPYRIILNEFHNMKTA